MIVVKMISIDKIRKKILKEIGLILLTVLYIFCVPIIVTWCIPIYCFRYCLSLFFKKIFRPDLGELVNSRSIVLGVDEFPKNPKWNLVVWLTQDRMMDLEKFKEYFKLKFVLAEENGHILYPEYQQSIEKWCGFHFWKWDTDFEINHHIREYDGKYGIGPIDEKLLIQVVKELTWKPWNPNRSPWEFLQIPNYIENCVEKQDENGQKTPKSILIFRIHHVLGDGYYILKLLMEDICGISLQKAAQPKQILRNIFTKTLIKSIFWIRAPYQFVKMMTKANDKNPWHIPPEKMIRPANAALSNQISLDYIKAIRDSHGVSFTAVVTAAVTGGMREMMIQLGIVPPKNIHQAVAVPMPGHPNKLRNHFIFSFMTLPIGTEDPLRRLHKIEQNLQELKYSSVPFLNFWKVPLVGSLFSCLMGPFTINRLTTCLMSNFPGTPEIPHFREVVVDDMMFAAGLGPGNTGIGFTLISCLGFIRIFSIADPNILKTDALVEELNTKIMGELELLKQLGECSKKFN